MSTHDTTWYVVADGGKARILSRHDDHFHTIHTFNAEGAGDIDDDASRGAHQLKAPHSDPKAEIKHEFARVVADYLNLAPESEVQAIVLAALVTSCTTSASGLTSLRQRSSLGASEGLDQHFRPRDRRAFEE
jgi:protein required for attachment to host cells